MHCFHLFSLIFILAGLSSISKTSKYTPTSVVVNPMIHHPSFYGLTSSNNPVLTTMKCQAEIKVINFNNCLLNAIVKSSDLPKKDWKISLREIFRQFSFEIDYQKFQQWSQANLLLPLSKLDDEEKRSLSVSHHHDEEYYVLHQHLDRCLALLNDLQRGTISMTLLPTNNSESSTMNSISPLAGRNRCVWKINRSTSRDFRRKET